MQSKSFNRFAKSIGEIVMNNYKPLMKNISAITQPIIAMTERMSKLVKPITAIISDLIPRIEIPEIEFSKFDIPNIPVILMKKKVLVRT